MKRYGMPYKGSKNRIAEKIVDFLMSESRFECAAETNVRSLYSSNSRAKKQERIFVPKR